MVVPHYLILLNYQDKIIYTIFSFLLLFSILSMEATPEGTQKRPQYSHRKDYLHHHYHHQHYNHEPNHQHHGIQITNPIVLIPIISILLVFAIFLVIFLLCKLKSASNESSKEHSNNKNDRVRKLSTDSTSISFNSSPDVKNRCLYRGSSGQTPTRRSAGIQVFTYKEIELATNSFSEENVIGIGKLGAVYRGILGDGIVAAIKKLNREGKQGGEREFRIEVDLLSRLHSSYLVELLGYCADQHHRVLVFEFMPNGSLQQHLHPSHKTHNQPLNWGTRLRIALDCARALEFLHENAVPSIIHGDFRCSNIVLDYNFRAKVSDLGLAKIVSDKINGQVSTQVMGTATGYLAPEYTSTGKLSTKSDVYSYGVVLLELITGRIPIDTKQPPGEHGLVSWALPRLTNREKVEEMVDPALKGQFSKKELIQVAAIAAVCVQQEADYRPFMTDVVQSLIPLVKSFSTSCPSNSFRYNSRAVSPRP